MEIPSGVTKSGSPLAKPMIVGSISRSSFARLDHTTEADGLIFLIL